MSAPKHTKGPWEQDRGSRQIIWGRAENGDYHHVADVWTYPARAAFSKLFSNGSFEEGRANARLIAAAPDLLEALKQAVEPCDSCDATGVLRPNDRQCPRCGGTGFHGSLKLSWGDIRAVIAKAEGTSEPGPARLAARFDFGAKP